MNRTSWKVVAILGMVSCGIADAATTNIRTDLRRWPSHYPLNPVDCGDDCWDVNFLNSYYRRSANKGYGKVDDCLENCSSNECLDCPKDCRAVLTNNPCAELETSRRTFPLSRLFFGKETFRGSDAFAGSNVCVPGNPFVSSARLTPNLKYDEKGAIFGIQLERRSECSKWRFGGHASIPFTVIEVSQELDCCCPCEETIDDMVIRRVERVDADNTTANSTYRDVFAYRLDFLSCLDSSLFPNDNMVVFGSNSTNRTLIGGSDITNLGRSPAAVPPSEALADVYVIRSTDGSFCGIPEADSTPIARNVSALALDGAGNGGGNGTRLYFDGGTNYSLLAGNRVAQGELFVIPNSTGAGDLMPKALHVQQVVEFALKELGNGRCTVRQFFLENCCIDFCGDARAVGIGNLDLDVYAGYDWCDTIWFEFLVGLRLPTDKAVEDARRPLLQPTGNNGHTEIRLQYRSGWMPTHWFAMTSEFSFNHVFNHKEAKAAPFKGATIINVGPTVEADVNYNYWIWRLDFTSFHPCNENLGFGIGYELYDKKHDRICLPPCKVADCLGVEQPVNPCILERNTHILANKLRGFAFIRWDYCELFGEASKVIAGKNGMNESEIKFGIQFYF